MTECLANIYIQYLPHKKKNRQEKRKQKFFLKPKQQHLIICRHAIDTFRRNMCAAIRYSLLWPFDNFVVCFERYTYYVSHTIKWLFRMLSIVQIWQHFQLCCGSNSSQNVSHVNVFVESASSF